MEYTAAVEKLYEGAKRAVILERVIETLIDQGYVSTQTVMGIEAEEEAKAKRLTNPD